MTKHKKKKLSSAMSRANDARRKREEYARKKNLETPNTTPPKGNVTPPNEVQLALKGMDKKKRKKPQASRETRKLIKTCVAYVSLNGVNAADLHSRSGMPMSACYNIVSKKHIYYLGAKTVLGMAAYMGRPEVVKFMQETKAKPEQVLVHATNRPEDGVGTGEGLKSPIPPHRDTFQSFQSPRIEDVLSPSLRAAIDNMASTKDMLPAEEVHRLVSALSFTDAQRKNKARQLREANSTIVKLESEIEEKDAQRQDSLDHNGSSHHMTHVCKENQRLRAALHILTAP